MGGVDLFDMLNGLHRIDHRCLKWYRRVLFWALNLCIINGWLLYRRHSNQYGAHANKLMLLRDFALEIRIYLRKANQLPPQIARKRGRPKGSNTTASDSQVIPEESDSESEQLVAISGLTKKPNTTDPINTIRFDNIGHLPEHSDKKNRCRLCQ